MMRRDGSVVAATLAALAAVACSASYDAELPPPGDDGGATAPGGPPRVLEADATTPEPTTGDAGGDADASAVADAGDAAPPPIEHRIFVTSTRYRGNFGGYAGATTRCANRAAAAGIPGTFKAILSDPGGNAKDRLASSGPVYLVGGGGARTLVAADAAELWGGTLKAAIAWDENGNAVPPGPVWTGSHPSGVLLGACHCDSWTKATITAVVGGCSYKDINGAWHIGGYAGESSATNGQWTSSSWGGGSSLDCNMQARLYCIEQ